MRNTLYLLLIVSIIFFMFVGVAIGSVTIPITTQLEIFYDYLAGYNNPNHTQFNFILLQIRVPRVLLTVVVGFALALCGAVMQGIFRNPLADPYILGIASGSTAGISVVSALGLAAIPALLPISAFIGGIIAVVIVYIVSISRLGTATNYTLILSGVAVGAMFSSMTTFFISISNNESLRYIVFWGMGSLATAQWSSIAYLSFVTIVTGFALQFFAAQLNALALGDEMAQHLGISAKSIKKILLALVTFITACIVCVCGTIGFVGLIVPHAMRLLFGADHRRLLVTSGLAGALFLLICDILARTIASPAEIPIGVMTSIFGGPFFLYLLKTSKNNLGTL